MSGSRTSITNPSTFKYGSLGKQVLFAIVTFGLYMIYWTHKVHKQLANGTDAQFSPGLRTVGWFLIPFYNFVVMWRTCHDCEPLTGKDGVLLFILFLVFPPASWFLIQSGINDVAVSGSS
jgi:hypothetical protein